jgi:hypothetical protein
MSRSIALTVFAAVLLVGQGCYPHQSHLEALSRMGARFPPPGPTTSIHFTSGLPDDPPEQPFTDESLRQALPHLRPLDRLELDVAGTHVTNASMPLVSQLKKLVELNVADTAVTAEGLLQLRGLPKLSTIVLAAGQVTDEQADEIRIAMPRVRLATVSRGLLVPYGAAGLRPVEKLSAVRSAATPAWVRVVLGLKSGVGWHG